MEGSSVGVLVGHDVCFMDGVIVGFLVGTKVGIKKGPVVVVCASNIDGTPIA